MREVSESAFYDCYRLKSVKLNEGLEKLGEKETVGGEAHEGNVFARSAVEDVVLPSTLKRLEAQTFCDCKYLKSIEIPSGTEYVGRKCFSRSTIAEITLPATLEKVEADAF